MDKCIIESRFSGRAAGATLVRCWEPKVETFHGNFIAITI